MACTGQYATAAQYNLFWCLSLDLTDAAVLAQVNQTLTIAAADVTAALVAVGACNCVSANMADYLVKLNAIDAAVLFNCACGPQLSQEAKSMWLDWLTEQFRQIRAGELDPCGLAGAMYPAIGSAEVNYTPWSEVEIRLHQAQRQP